MTMNDTPALTEDALSYGIGGVIATDRFEAARYWIGHESGDVFGGDSDYDGPTLTVEVADAADAQAMLEAISGDAFRRGVEAGWAERLKQERNNAEVAAHRRAPTDSSLVRAIEDAELRERSGIPSDVHLTLDLAKRIMAEIQDDRAALTPAAQPADDALRVAVKPLEWERDDDGNYRAETDFGAEGIDRMTYADGSFAGYEVWGLTDLFAGFEVAQAAAQADFEARIRSCLAAQASDGGAS